MLMKRMTMSFSVLAFDFGASSGRAIKAVFTDGTLSYKEVHRFENVPIEKEGTLYWDFDTLMEQVYIGIQKAGEFDSIGFDTWGVDFGLLGEDGKLLELPVHYRDRRTEGMCQEAEKFMSMPELYGKTGTQIMAINTLFQLLSLKENRPEVLERAKTLLFMPDLFGYMLTGNAVCERSIASTAQMLDLTKGRWCHSVLEKFEIPKDLLKETIPSGTILGEYQGKKVIAVAGHDTQCAVAAMPATTENPAFLSCGTWSLLGCELDAPVLTEESRLSELSNELGANGKVNYLKNIIGLWLIQESRRAWRRKGEEYSYADLERKALAAKPLQCFIDPDAPEFAPPGDIPERVREYCRKTGQHVPETVGEVMRCIYESLALKYRLGISQLQDMTGKKFDVLHVLGGGTKDGLLCQMTADCCNIPVKAGPIEATAIGNILIQLVALGALPDIEAGRKWIASAEPIKHFTPNNTQAWDAAFAIYKTII